MMHQIPLITVVLYTHRLKRAVSRYNTPVQTPLYVLRVTQRGTLNPGLLSIVVTRALTRSLPTESLTMPYFKTM